MTGNGDKPQGWGGDTSALALSVCICVNIPSSLKASCRKFHLAPVVIMSKLEDLAKLNDLKKQGVLSDEEFEREKKLILEGDKTPDDKISTASPQEDQSWKKIPLRKKFWVQLLWGLLLPPVGLILMLVYPSYWKDKSGVKRTGKVLKTVFFVGCFLSWMIFIGKQGHSSELPACDSSEVESLLEEMIEDNPANRLVNLKLVQVTKTKQLSYNEKIPERHCAVEAALNSGSESIRLRVTRGKESGSFLMETY